MPRGVEQTRLDHRFLHRRDLVVHALARPAYEFHRRFQMPSPRRELEGPASPLPISPTVFASRIDDRYHLVREFPTLHLFGDDQTTECCIWPTDELRDKEITQLAWRSVLEHERLQSGHPELLAAKILFLIDALPPSLIPEFLPQDPKYGRPPKLELSSLSRACGVSVSTLNNFLPRLRDGGIADLSIEQVFHPSREPNDD